MWKDIVEQDKPQMSVSRMRIVRCIPKAANTHSQYVILIAFPPQQCLNQRTLMLPSTYIACLVYFDAVRLPTHILVPLFATSVVISRRFRRVSVVAKSA